MQLDRSTASETDRTQTNTAQRIRLVASRVLRGCNPYFDNTVILQTYKVPQGVNGSGKVPERLPDGASKRYLDFFSGTGVSDIFATLDPELVERLNSGIDVPVSDLLLHAILAMEGVTASKSLRLGETGFSKVISGRETGRFSLVWRSEAPGPSRRAAQVALIGLNACLRYDHGSPSSDHEFAAALQDLRDRAQRGAVSPTVAILIDAAKRPKQIGAWRPRTGR